MKADAITENGTETVSTAAIFLNSPAPAWWYSSAPDRWLPCNRPMLLLLPPDRLLPLPTRMPTFILAPMAGSPVS